MRGFSLAWACDPSVMISASASAVTAYFISHRTRLVVTVTNAQPGGGYYSIAFESSATRAQCSTWRRCLLQHYNCIAQIVYSRGVLLRIIATIVLAHDAAARLLHLFVALS